MSVVPMKLLTIAGPLERFDDVVRACVIDQEFHPENALQLMRSVKGLRPLELENPYSALLHRSVADEAGIPLAYAPFDPASPLEDFASYFDSLSGRIAALHRRREELEHKADEARSMVDQLQNLRGLNVSLDELWGLDHARFRYGYLPRETYDGFREALNEEEDIFFVPTTLGARRVYGVYFTTKEAHHKVDSLFNSLHFVRIRLEDPPGGTVDNATAELNAQVEAAQAAVAQVGQELEELRRQVEVLRLENAVMRETIDVLKADDPRLDPSMLTNRERTRVVDAIRGEFGLAACLKAVGLKRSTYYYERGAIAAGDRYAVLRARVAGLFEQGGRAWGYRTIHRMLRLDESDPIVVSEKVVRRIMREGAMRPVYLKRPKRWSSYAGEIGEAPANLVERDFHADAPNMLWVTDVTQFTMDGYKCWLSPVVDCFDGMVVSWTLSRSPNADMANRMLLDAVATLRDGEHPIIHSDRGCHYRWDEWIRICEEHGLIRSMSAKGCSPDNAAAEGFFGRLKNELFYGRDWRGVGYEEFRERLAAYLTHYNETRIKKSLDWMSPVQYRRSLGLAA